jgi:hypothetical protein
MVIDNQLESSPALSSTSMVITAGNKGLGTGKQVAEMEYFYRGNRGDKYGLQHFPFNWSLSTKTMSDVAGTYNILELNHSYEQKELNSINLKKEATIAVKEASGTTLMDALLVDIQTFTVAS